MQQQHTRPRRRPPDRRANGSRPLHRADPRQLLGPARVPALPAAARGRPRLGALEHRPGGALAGGRPAARARPTSSASASAPAGSLRRACRRTWCPANFRHGARYAWTALLEAAREDERPALLESADLLFEFVDRVSQLFSDTYESAGPPPSAPRRTAARTGCSSGSARKPLAARTTASLSGSASISTAPHRPFALVGAIAAVREHADPRRRSARAACWPRRRAAVSSALAGTPAPLGSCPRRRGHSRKAAPRRAASWPRRSTSCARSSGWPRGAGGPGGGTVDDHLAELLLRGSPRLAARLRARVYGRLAASDPSSRARSTS